MRVLGLVRFPNLVIVGLTQYLLYGQLLLPLLEAHKIEPLLDLFHFAMLSFATILITAGGYVINDILDREIDAVNKPERQIIGKQVSVQMGYNLYVFLLAVGFIIAVYLAFYVGQPLLLSIYPIAVAGLYAYSRYLKKQALSGNILVSLYCGGVAWIVLFAERQAVHELQAIAPESAQWIYQVFYWYIAFAFLSTFFRELVKDLEDVLGDQAQDCRTTPIVFGIKKAKIIAGFLGILLLVFVFIMLQTMETLFVETWAWLFVIIGIAIPTGIALLWLVQAKSKAQFHRISQLAKFIMLNGLLFLIFICW